MMLTVSEWFTTIQGEGPSLGIPSFFLRLGNCNLACTWCDTAYTWDWNRYDRDHELREVSIDDVVQALLDSSASNLVITGGEPMIQRQAIEGLVCRVPERHTIEMETAGTLSPGPALRDRVTRWNVSPKLANSGNSVAHRLRWEVLKDLATLPTSTFKFVVSEPEDFVEIDEIIANIGVPADRVCVMPEGVTAEQCMARSRWVVELCIGRNWRFTPRWHVHLWGGERGH